MLENVKVITSDDEQEFDAYTDGYTQKGWLSVWMTESQLREWMSSTPYDMRIMPNGDAILYYEQEESYPLVKNVLTNDGMKDLYMLDGLAEFMRADEWR